MKKQTARTLMIVVGVLILVVIVALGSAVWLFTRSFIVDKADAASAAQRFDEIRRRFDGVTPVLGIRDEKAYVVRKAPEPGGAQNLSLLRIVAWDPDDDDFARIDLPFWLLRMKSGPIEISADRSAIGDTGLGITVEELERYGPTLVLDHESERGSKVLVWTE